jgi:hypothetical protein
MVGKSVSVAQIGAQMDGNANNFAFIAASTSTQAPATSSDATNLRLACNNSSSAICASASIFLARAAL